MRTRYNGVEQGGGGGAVTPEAVGDAWGDWVSGEGVAAGVAYTLDASRVSTVDLSAATYEAGSVSGGSASHVAGVARLAIGSSGTCTYLAGSTSAPRCRITLPSLRSAWRFRVEVRLASVGSGGSAENVWHAVIGVRHGAASHGAHLRVGFDGRPDLCQRSAGGQVATGAASAVAIDGTGWVALEYDRGALRVEYGSGSGTTPPTTWTQLYATGALHTALGITQPFGGSGTAAPAKPTELYLALDRTAAAVGAAATVDLGPVRVWDLGR